MALLVNGERIEDDVIKQEAEKLRPEYERAFAEMEQKQRESQLLDWSRENVIEKTLLRQKAKSENGEVTESEIEAGVKQAKEQYYNNREFSPEQEKILRQGVIEHIKFERFINRVCKDVPPPSQEQVREFYEENKENFKTPIQVRVSHIVKHVGGNVDEQAARLQIEKAYEEIKKGASFELTAKKYSDCPDNDGDLGEIMPGQMVEEFEDVVFNLGVGEISPIFSTRFGFHIAKVYDKKPPQIVEFDKVKDYIADSLYQKIKVEALEKYVDQLRAEAQIQDV